MKKILSLLLVTISNLQLASAQQQWGIECYRYFRASPAYQPIAYFRSADDWYGELRYNYEADKTFSLYGGRSISGGNKLRYEFATMLGFSTGTFTGLSLATSAEAEWKNLYFSSQSQYSLDTRRSDSLSGKLRTGNFFFSWTELGYSLGDHVSAGLALQYTLQREASVFSPGFAVSAHAGRFHFPLYLFDPFHTRRYYVVGIAYNWKPD